MESNYVQIFLNRIAEIVESFTIFVTDSKSLLKDHVMADDLTNRKLLDVV